MPCLSPSPSRGRPGWGWVLPGLEGNPSPPNPPLEGEGFNMCHGFFAISEITSKCGGRFSRVTVSEVCTVRPALSANLRRAFSLKPRLAWQLASTPDGKRGGEGKGVEVRVDTGGRRSINKKNKQTT